MKTYSLDLRRRVLSAAPRDDRTITEVGELFGASATFINKTLRLHRVGADPAPRRHGGGTPRASASATTSCCARPSPRTTAPRSASCANTSRRGRV
jgi:transposase